MAKGKTVKSGPKKVQRKVKAKVKRTKANAVPKKSAGNPLETINMRDSVKVIRKPKRVESTSKLNSIIDIFENNDLNDREKKHRLSQLNTKNEIDLMDGGEDGAQSNSSDVIVKEIPTFTNRLKMWESMTDIPIKDIEDNDNDNDNSEDEMLVGISEQDVESEFDSDDDPFPKANAKTIKKKSNPPKVQKKRSSAKKRVVKKTVSKKQMTPEKPSSDESSSDESSIDPFNL
jgi:hypothetical protein